MIIVLQAIVTLSFAESVKVLEQVYKNLARIISHLRLADRLKAFKYHMKEATSLFICYICLSN